MKRDTGILRCLLALLLLVLLMGSGLLYLASLEGAQNWPELAHLRLPIYLAVLIGLIPVVAAIRAVFAFLAVVDRGEALSTRTVEILRRLRLLVGLFAAYFVLGLVGFWAVTGMMHASLLFTWFGLEVAALFVFTMVSLLERVFVAALELRQDNELTV